MVTVEKGEKELGTFFETSSLKAERCWTSKGQQAHHGKLKLTINSTNTIVGHVKQSDIKTTVLCLSTLELCELKRLLKHFSLKTLDWTDKAPKEGKLTPDLFFRG